jgi:cadmium resistance protein CadD (predicted permease)
MSAIKIIGYIGSAILIFFGILFVWGAFSPDGSPGWIIVGIISIGIGFAIIWFTSRQKSASQADQNVTLKIDLPANVNLETLKCKSCGGTLTMDNIQMVAGAPVVNCPYCKSTYQLTEDPKW